MSGKNSRGRDYTWLLTVGAALVVVIRYAAAFTASDMGQMLGWVSDTTTFLMAVSGVGMGFLVVFGQLYAFDGWKRSMPQAGKRITFRFVLLTLVSLLLIITDVAILVPFTVSRIRHESISLVLGEWDWLWSTAVNIAPALLLAGVALGNQVVSTAQTSHDAQANAGTNDSRTFAEAKEAKKYSGLENADKYYILNTKSEVAARELGVTVRAVQKWRLKIQEEVKQGSL